MNMFISIKYKLLFSCLFLSLALIVIPLYTNLQMQTKMLSMNEFSTHIVPSIGLLEQQRSTISRIKITLDNFINLQGSSQVEGVGAGLNKNLLLADIEKLSRLKDSYYDSMSANDSTVEAKKKADFDNLSNAFVLDIVNYTREKEMHTAEGKLEIYRSRLEASQQLLEKFILTLIAHEYEQVEMIGKSIHEQIDRLSKINVGLFAFATLLALTISFVTARIISSPIIKLRQVAEKIAAGDFTQEIKINSLDETEVLANTMQQMLQRTLLTARQAGMAEIASSVLHNIGNILNSINVAATSLHEKLVKTDLAGLTLVSKLLQEHQHDFASYVADDPKGKTVIPYLDELAKFWNSKKNEFLQDIVTVTNNINHVKEIIAMQQSISKSIALVETVKVDKVIDEAFKLNEANFTNFNVNIILEYTVQPSILIDRVKLLQILVNLIRNAYEAVADVTLKDKSITARLLEADQQHIMIQIIDNGVGIKPENVEKIFSYGFTTRKKGHGIGLHNTLLIASELGGSLTFTSSGEGQGTTFSLLLPIQAANNVGK